MSSVFLELNTMIIIIIIYNVIIFYLKWNSFVYWFIFRFVFFLLLTDSVCARVCGWVFFFRMIHIPILTLIIFMFHIWLHPIKYWYHIHIRHASMYVCVAVFCVRFCYPLNQPKYNICIIVHVTWRHTDLVYLRIRIELYAVCSWEHAWCYVLLLISLL